MNPVLVKPCACTLCLGVVVRFDDCRCPGGIHVNPRCFVTRGTK